MKMKRFFLLVGLVLMAMLIAGCSSENKKVPDSVLQMEVDLADTSWEAREELDEYPSTWSATHEWDAEAYTDTVNVTITWMTKYSKEQMSKRLVYQYNRTSDLWTIISGKHTEWEYKTIYTKALEGHYEVSVGVNHWDTPEERQPKNSKCWLHIQEVTDAEIRFTAEFLLPQGVEGTYMGHFGLKYTGMISEEVPSVRFIVTETVANDGENYLFLGNYLPDVYAEKDPGRLRKSLYIRLPGATDSYLYPECVLDVDELYYASADW